MMKKLETPQFDPQINFAKFLEVRLYDFPPQHYNNPLVPVYPIDKSDINIPDTKYVNESLVVCNKLICVCPNTFDRKPVNCVKIYNNSKKLVYGTTNGNLISYDIIHNNFAFASKSQVHQSSIRSLQFTKSESYLLTGDNTGTIVYLDSSLNYKTKIKAHNDTITDINFSISDAKYITSSDDKSTKIFDLNTGLEEAIFTEHGSDVKSCDWNPIKNLVCSGGKDQLLKLWDPRLGEAITTLHPHKNTINRLRFNKNGNWLVSASKDHSLKVIDIRIMKELQIFKGHEQEVNTVTWHPVLEDYFCSAGADGYIIHWLVGQSKSLIIKSAHDKEIFDLCFNSYGNILSSGSNDSTLKFWIRENRLF